MNVIFVKQTAKAGFLPPHHSSKRTIIFDSVYFSNDGKAKNLRIKFKTQLIVNKTWLLSDLLPKTNWFIYYESAKRNQTKNKQNDYKKVIQNILGFYTGEKKIVIKHSSETKRNQQHNRMIVSFIQIFYWFCTKTTEIHNGTLLINWENNHRIKLRQQTNYINGKVPQLRDHPPRLCIS